MAISENTSITVGQFKLGPLELYNLVLRRWKLIAGTVVTGVGVVMIMVLLQTPLYTATTEVILDPRSKAVSGESDVLSGLGMDAAAISSQVRIIKSASVARRVIEKLGLDKDVEFNPDGVRSKSWLARLTGGFLGGASENEEELKPTTQQMRHMVDVFKSRVKARRIGKTYIIAISFTSRDPSKAAKIANQVADSYLYNQLEGKWEFARRTNRWLRERLADLQTKVQASEKAVELYISEHDLVGAKGKTPFEAELDGLNEKLILARVELSEKHTQFQQIQDVLKSRGRLSSIGALAKSDEIRKLRAERARLAQEEAELITLYTKRHPKIISKRNERRDLERQIEREAGKVVDTIKASYHTAKRRVALLKSNLSELRNKTRGERSASIRLRELKREAAADKAIYEAFLNRSKQSSQQETFAAADTRVIAAAQAPRTPSSPNKRRAFLLSLIGFAGLGLALAFFLDMLNNSFKSPDEIEEVLQVPHIVSTPNLAQSDLFHEGQDIPIDRYAIMRPLTPFAEAMRTLKVSLEMSNIDRSSQVVLITSVFPNEGKTSICANFAQHAANVGAKTLLIDADLRNPSLSARIAPEQKVGLIDILSQRARREDAIIEDYTGLHILTSQAVQYNSAEVLGSASMRSLLSELRQDYDLIVMDSSPVMPVIDAKVLLESVDSMALVLEWDKTPKDAARNVLNLLASQKEKIAGVIFNKMEPAKVRGYRGYGYGGYYQAGGYYGAGG